MCFKYCIFYCVWMNFTLWAGRFDSFLEYQKHLGNMVEIPKNAKMYRKHSILLSELRKDILKVSRKATNGISRQDYIFLKNTSAQAAAMAPFAHEQGIFGNGVTILLLEDSGITHHEVRNYVETRSRDKPIENFAYSTDHGSSMAAYIHAISPGACIRVRPTSDFSSMENVRIINASFGNQKQQGFKNLFSNLPDKKNILIVKSAGNHKENLSTDPHTDNCDDLLQSTIFTGSLRQDYKPRTFSALPGPMEKFQHNFLWVLSDESLSASGPEGSSEYSPQSGTSGAAAILSGAAALVLSMYPTLSTAKLKEVLLESADRDIFQLFNNGYNAIYINDPKEKPKTTRKTDYLTFKEYDPAFWGMGLLNIKNALIYAAIKNLYPSLQVPELRKYTFDVLNFERKIAAKKIQKIFQKRAKHDLGRRPSLTINIDIPNRIFAKAPGVPSGEGIPEQSDAEILSSQSIEFPKPPRELTVISNSASASNMNAEEQPWVTFKAPRGSSVNLCRFLGSEKTDLKYHFDQFFQKELLPLFMLPVPTEILANEIILKYSNLLNPFKANRVIYTEKHSNCLSGQFYTIPDTITILDLVYDGLRLNRFLWNERFKERMETFPIMLYQKIQLICVRNQAAKQVVKSGILSILDEIRNHGPFAPNSDHVLFNFLTDNNLLDVGFNSFKGKHGGDELIVEENLGINCLFTHEISKHLEIATSWQKEKFRKFFQTPVGTSYCAQIAVEKFRQTFDVIVDYKKEDLSQQIQKFFAEILSNMEIYIPDFVDFLKTYAKGNPHFTNALIQEFQGTILFNEQRLIMGNHLVAACRNILI